MQGDGGGLHLPGICYELIPSEGARPELQPSRNHRPDPAEGSVRGPRVQPGETQVGTQGACCRLSAL